ncbi:hypothetical protein [Polaribacter sp. Hel_I_88]|uniref:hypothetical protein n=1 Tax=Polaribacter sp. Hel_I_88 TaxID=1250006 RepID=UPI00047919DF|nr:hypothetical protein [Polaribacter sp. Hel_I_88]
MIKTLKSLGILVSNFIVCIGAGHGFGPIILIELFSINSLIFEGEFAFNGGDLPSFSFSNSYENMLLYFLLFSFIGQIFFLSSIFKFFNNKINVSLKSLGILSMLFGFFLITKNLFNDGLAVFTFVTGIPFLCFVFLDIKSFSNE